MPNLLFDALFERGVGGAPAIETKTRTIDYAELRGETGKLASLADGAVNPYLLQAGLLAAGLDGIAPAPDWSSSTRIASASWPPIGCSCSPNRTNTGPPNG